MRGSGTLTEKQERMRAKNQRTQQQELAKATCIVCKARKAREGTVYCSRCTATDFQNQLRDTLPGMPVPAQSKPEAALPQSVDQPGDTTALGIQRNLAQEQVDDILELEEEADKVEILHPTRAELAPGNYTRSQAAEMLGVSATTLMRWERKGKIPMPKKIIHSNTVVYTEEILLKAREYMAQSYVPPTDAVAPGTPTQGFRFAAKKSAVKINRRLERTVAASLGSLGRKIF